MSIYNAASHDELRREVMRLCMAAIDEKLFNSGVPSLTCCERIVPRVPAAAPELRTLVFSDGYTYRWNTTGLEYASKVRKGEWVKADQVPMSDLAMVLDLREKPLVEEPVVPARELIAWAVIDKDGLVYRTFQARSEDEEDAQQCAIDCDADWPGDAPHVVVPIYRTTDTTDREGGV